MRRETLEAHRKARSAELRETLCICVCDRPMEDDEVPGARGQICI